MQPRIVFLIILIFSLSIQSIHATGPNTPPPGGFTGGIFSVYFQNIVAFNAGSGMCPTGQGVVGFNTGSSAFYGTPICESLTLTPGIAGQTLVSNGSDWIATSNVFHSGANVGIGTTDPQTRLDINGQVRIQGGSPGSGKVLTSDANGVANWGNVVIGLPCTPGGTGTHNTCYGIQALQNNTTGDANTANGYQALTSNTTGVGNTALGYATLYSNADAWFNTAIGELALYSNTSGASNTAIGVSTLFNNTTGYDNSAIGLQALDSNTTGNWNTANGAHAGSNLTSGNNNIAIGANTNFPSATASNQLNIGNWIYGNNGNIGIGVSSPAVKLDVNGDTTTDMLHTRGTGGWINDTYGGGFFMNEPYWVRTYSSRGIWTDAGLLGSQGGLSVGYWGGASPSGGAIIAGNVGIGTDIPGANLEVKGNGWYPLMVNTTNTGGGGIAVHPNDVTKRVEYSVTGTGDIKLWANGNRLIIKRDTGNVGIGTDDPLHKLDIIGDARASRLYTDNETPLATNELASKAYVDAAVSSAGGPSALGVLDTANPEFLCASDPDGASCLISQFKQLNNNLYLLDYASSTYVVGGSSYWTTSYTHSLRNDNLISSVESDGLGTVSPYLNNYIPYDPIWKCPTGSCYMGARKYVSYVSPPDMFGYTTSYYSYQIIKFDYSTVPQTRTVMNNIGGPTGINSLGIIIPNNTDGGFYNVVGSQIRRYNSGGTLIFSSTTGGFSPSYGVYNSQYYVQCNTSGANLVCNTRDLATNLAIVNTFTVNSFASTVGNPIGLTSDNRIIFNKLGVYNTSGTFIGMLPAQYVGQTITQVEDIGGGKIATLCGGDIIYYNGLSLLGNPDGLNIPFQKITISGISYYNGKIYAVGYDTGNNINIWKGSFSVPN